MDGSNQEGKIYGMIPKSAVEPEEFIDFQRTAYRILAKSFNAFGVNTAEYSIDRTSKRILNYLELVSKSRGEGGQ